MNDSMKMIARIRSEFPEKFGIPRQSGLVSSLRSSIVMEPEYRKAEAFKGLDAFSHIWILWEFSEAVRTQWSPTVRPPRLGGNKRMGVFATRSPFRPNPIGLSSVKLDRIDWHAAEGPVLWVSGADLMDGTPIFDIKPYLPFTDSHPEAAGGFAAPVKDKKLNVSCSDSLKKLIPVEKQTTVFELLAEDPRPSYQQDPERVYGMTFAGLEIRFTVCGTMATIREVCNREAGNEHSNH